MAILSVAMAAALVIGIGSASAQSTSEHIWASSAWVLYGELTPGFGNMNPAALTPLGAQQMYSQATMFRARYLGHSSDEQENVTSIAPIVGIQTNVIDNDQLSILSTTDRFATAGALAFMQGLYPPLNQAWINKTGGSEAFLLSNGSSIDYPLGGYQYPDIQSSSMFDQDSIWLQGQAVCSNYIKSLLDFDSDSDVVSAQANSSKFYKGVATRIFSDFDSSAVNFDNAYELYEYAAYHATHDNDSQIDSNDLVNLRLMAAEEQRFRNANLSASGNTEGDMIRAVAGRTMATKVMSLFEDNINSAGNSKKFNVAFSPLEPFIAFAALSKLTEGASGDTFLQLPYPGATMVFELFSIGGDESIYPPTDKLWVRFFYRNSTGPEAELTAYSLFANGVNNYLMTYPDFKAAMDQIGLASASDWCGLCGSALFCTSLLSNTGTSSPIPTPRPTSGTTTTVMSPAVAGVIGAAVTIAVVGIAALAATLLGGVRFHRSDSKQRNSTIGGFKGAEKMASDTDIAYVQGGARHERTGSWELRNGGKGDSEQGVVSVTPVAPVEPASTLGATVQARDLRNPAKNVDDDAISEIGHSPVDPREF
ncbi:histidine phosphatase superfamily [Lasiosphaeria ovina]|uniref:Histidine phosphatase superfamily n=1 Tax=Lasiosphaeria ovina TaxID=92902 RepID=A0AAE0K879_9PEZI|nr:histidine phosphatase superfamily [Lasiosphaeria ovina]